MEPQQEAQAQQQQQQQQAPAPSATALNMNPSAFVDDLHNAVGSPGTGCARGQRVSRRRN
jgi:hypothetical protein